MVLADRLLSLRSVEKLCIRNINPTPLFHALSENTEHCAVSTLGVALGDPELVRSVSMGPCSTSQPVPLKAHLYTLCVQVPYPSTILVTSYRTLATFPVIHHAEAKHVYLTLHLLDYFILIILKCSNLALACFIHARLASSSSQDWRAVNHVTLPFIFLLDLLCCSTNFPRCHLLVGRDYSVLRCLKKHC